MKIQGLEVRDCEEIKTTIYECAYCSKRFLNKNSYYNHIGRNYCNGYFIDLKKMTKYYNDNKITADEYYDWCYEKGYLYTLVELTSEEKEKISDRVFKKISILYDCEEDY